METGGEKSGRIKMLEAMYYEHGPAVLSFLRQRTEACAAEDLLQETFAQALCHLNRLDRVRSVRAWLITIARNLFLNELRRKRIQPLDNLHKFPAQSKPKENPRLEAVRRAIDKLPGQHREILLLKWHDGLSYDQIARILKVPIGTVRSRLHYALGRVRDMLKTEGVPFNQRGKE